MFIVKNLTYAPIENWNLFFIFMLFLSFIKTPRNKYASKFRNQEIVVQKTIILVIIINKSNRLRTEKRFN